VTAHVGTTVGDWVRAWPTLPAFAVAVLLSAVFAIAARRLMRSPHTADPKAGPYTSDSWNEVGK
jgi:hypothetical protein